MNVFPNIMPPKRGQGGMEGGSGIKPKAIEQPNSPESSNVPHEEIDVPVLTDRDKEYVEKYGATRRDIMAALGEAAKKFPIVTFNKLTVEAAKILQLVKDDIYQSTLRYQAFLHNEELTQGEKEDIGLPDLKRTVRRD